MKTKNDDAEPDEFTYTGVWLGSRIAIAGPIEKVIGTQ